MAEIKVEPKRGGLGWLWVVIILALIAAAIWYFLNSRTAPGTAVPADSTRTSMVGSATIDAPAYMSVEGMSHG